MNILAHRGFWIKPIEKNSLKSFIDACEKGYGIETDIRDYKGKLVISHDIPDESSISIDSFLEVCGKFPNSTLALNIKCDGLTDLLKTKLEEYKIKNYFVFDMSVPDSIKYFKSNMNVFERLSEYEKAIAFGSQSKGIWLDAFIDDWYLNSLDSITKILPTVCIVSPELHGRDKDQTWAKLLEFSKNYSGELMLCTDYPDQAKEYFNEKN